MSHPQFQVGQVVTFTLENFDKVTVKEVLPTPYADYPSENPEYFYNYKCERVDGSKVSTYESNLNPIVKPL